MLNRIVTICIFSTLFFSSYVLFKEPFEFYLPYLFIVILLPFLAFKNKFPVKIMGIFLLMLLPALFSVSVGDNTYALFFKIFLNILISVLFYYYIFHVYKLDVMTLFSFYMKGALIISIIGLIQFLSFKIGFTYGYDYHWIGLNKWGVSYGGSFGIRINSIFSEPSYFGGSISAAFFIALYNLFTRNKYFINTMQSLLIVVIYFLTFSSVSYLGVFISLILIMINMGLLRYVLIFTPIILGSYYYLYTNVAEFRERVDGLDALYDGQVKKIGDVHGSSFVQYNNFHVATENLKKNPLFGTGLGSHQIAYDKYSLAKQFKVTDDFNKSDGNSMFIRLMSETGLVGLIFMFLFIRKYFVLRNPKNKDDFLWLISSGALVVILLQLFRQGNYTYNGFMFYMWLYYYTKVVSRNDAIESGNNLEEI